jgi:hypothetical protein
MPALILVACAGLFAVALPVLRGQIYTDAEPDDLNRQALPYRFFYERCLKAGDAFLWCPDIQCGFDLHGEGQVGMYHPLHLVLYRSLPLQTAFNVELLLNYPVMLIGMMLFLRRWGISREAAFFGGIAFAFSTFNLIRIPNPNALDIIAHYSWLLLAVDLVMRESRRRATWGLLFAAVLVGSMLLCGYPQFFLFGGLLAATFALALAVRRPVPVGRLIGLAAAGVVGLLLGAVQLLPTYNTLTQSYRETPTYEFRVAGSLNPLNILQLVVPYLYRGGTLVSQPDAFAPHEEFVFYNGAVLLPLLLWLIARRKELGAARLPAIWAATLGLVAVLLALGRGTPLYPLYSRIPGLGLFRMPVRHVVIVQCCMAVLVAIASADLASPRKPPSRRLLLYLAVPVLASLLIAGIAVLMLSAATPDDWKPTLFSPPALIWMGPALVATGTAIVTWAAHGSRIALVALAAFTMADLVIYGVGALYLRPATDLETLAARLSVPPAYERDRLGSIDDLLYLFRGYRLSAGYVALTPRHRLNYSDPVAMRIAGAAWNWQNLGQGTSRWTPVSDALPRARLVSRALVSDDPARDVQRIDPATTALTDAPLDLPPEEGDNGIVWLATDRPGWIEVSISAPTRRLLIVSERFTPDWQATVDGQPVAVVAAYGDFMGCVVESGIHHVTLRYAPRSFRMGMTISLIGVGIVIACCALLFWTRRPLRRESP